MKINNNKIELKTKLQKHINDNVKRRNALNEKAKIKLTQSEIIKQALSTANLHQGSNKKIAFNDDKNFSDTKLSNNNPCSNNEKHQKSVLFNESESEDDNFEIQEKSQFQGKKGFELLKLQSSYGNDERFKIDERFYEEENDVSHVIEEVDSNGNTKPSNKINSQAEMGDDFINESSSNKKNKKRLHEMIRYDVFNKEHEKYEKKQTVSENKEITIKKKHNIKKNETPIIKPIVSQEKFYEVAENIKDSFKKKSDSTEFSLLQTYGSNNTEVTFENGDDMEESEEGSPKPKKRKKDKNEENHVKFLNNSNSVSETTNNFKQGIIAKGIWKESFFFNSNDTRLEEGVAFINKKNSPEAESAAENFDVARKKLREIIRLHNKKMLSKKNPFKKKIGGMSKKQMAALKFKNGQKSKRVFRKKL